MATYRPKVRSTRFLTEELPDELLIYDVDRNEAHCLNGSAARVWTLCDGQRTVADIARMLDGDLEPERAEAVVWCALDLFAEKHLLEGDVVQDGPVLRDRPTDMTRRQMVLRLGLVVGLLPVVESIVAPPAALAQSGSTAFTGTTPP
jgi:Coenzyme PQQ synthesis protein D (PqqD)